MIESFWTIPATDNLRTPLTIMREQATALTEQTKGALVGVVETTPMVSDILSVSLSIQVPALNDYKYRLLTYQQPIALYPGWLRCSLDTTMEQVTTEEEFVRLLKATLSSQAVKNLIASLLVQAVAA